MTRLLLTPVKNEAALLGPFLDHHAPLFDRILVADQGSTDGSWEIATSHPSVEAIRNTAQEFNERERRQLLLDKARLIDPEALLVGLDADEFLLTEPAEWNAKCREWRDRIPDAAIQLPWMCLAPGAREWFRLAAVFCRPVTGGSLPDSRIHVPRVPLGPAPDHQGEIPVLHLNLLWPRRQQMKTWWYMALEVEMLGALSIDSRRLYRRSGTGEFPNRQSVPADQAAAISKLLRKIDLTDTWDTWHKECLLEMLQKDIAGNLRNAALWDYPWRRELACLGKPDHPGPSLVGRLADWWIDATNDRRRHATVRAIDYLLRRLPPFHPARTRSTPEVSPPSI
jgi:hypothetical protein